MNRLYTSILALACAAGSQAQVIFNVLAPQNVAGTYNITWVTSADGWGTVDILDPANAVEDTLAFINDNSTADSLGCDTANVGPDVNGKIAVIYRGTCEFGVKAMGAESHGARAVIIINNVAGDPLAMGAGAVGANVTIPVVMISQADGALLRAAVDAGVCVGFIGSLNGLYANDVGFFRSDVLLPEYGTFPGILATNSGEYSVPLAIWLTNYGNQAQTGITATAEILQEGNVMYSYTSDPFDLVAGDSLLVELGTYSAETYSGKYTLNYSATIPTTDEFDANNSYSTSFDVVDELYSFSPVDPGTGLPFVPGHGAAGGAAAGWQTCIHFQNDNASRVALTGFWFSAVTQTAGADLDGELFGIAAYHWDTEFGGISEQPEINLVSLMEHDFEVPIGYEEGTALFAQFEEPVMLEDGLRYLICLSIQSDTIRIGYNSGLNYDRNDTWFDQPMNMIYTVSDDTWYTGWSGGSVNTLGAVLIDANTIGVEENGVLEDALPYPNPAADIIRVPVKGLAGAASLRIIDAKGAIASTQRVRGTEGTVAVDVAGLAPGMYTFEMIPDNGTARTFRVLVGR